MNFLRLLGGKTQLFECCGIPINISGSFIFLLLLLILESGSLELGFITALLLAFSITVHELGHALTARAFGFRTRDITLSLLGGCASLIALPRKAWQEFLTALAGPMVSFLVALGAYGLRVALNETSSFFVLGMLEFLLVMNLMLGLFNLLPALPMDGGRIFKSVLRFFVDRLTATRFAMYVGRGLAVALVVLPLLGIRNLWFIPIGGFLGLRVLIAFMIWQESWREYQMALFERNERGWSQADFEARVSPPPYARD